MPTLTVGTNSYASVDNATIYFDNRVGAIDAWENLDVEDQQRLLITASSPISRLVKTEFKMPFTPDAAQGLQDATFEYVLAIQADNKVITNKNTEDNKKLVKAGSVTVEFFERRASTKLPSIVMDILSEGGFLVSLLLTGSVVNGAGCPSHFGDSDTQNINGGFY